MSWKDWSYWIKGGVSFGIIGLIFGVYLIYQLFSIPNSNDVFGGVTM